MPCLEDGAGVDVASVVPGVPSAAICKRLTCPSAGAGVSVEPGQSA